MDITPIADSRALADFCDRQRGADYLAVDTEFLRDRTYWPRLCLVQVAGPNEAVAIDTLVPELDPQPLYELMADRSLLKVFHAGLQVLGELLVFLHVEHGNHSLRWVPVV